ncbi:DUF2225 domain-containing protein [Anaerocolumna aminovalerica]|jgi:uncharacterized protein (DUF2225 family)|uniref:DUF2225 domain-containing protein n=1 Tax=Anaerocolumna aminovalerica TaxID=1527 RepID=A0A1I5DXN3_9FIRM|nr:DUF2225 domain-containing protein [Anaerocolumna aminovalerica]MBU5332826.1 DUF2225 domain-containing protein [Anaerocolumna aminovalerica]MDU6263418.1 DUF2225 domain-containing protein [Anaerocolumna aminovalerica]SFO03830.1 hypothetical protein SAMN04489757_10743 [Anaerocolumna aminovalerica]
MANLFSGLEAFGLGKMSDLDVYASEDKNSKNGDNSAQANEKEKIVEADFLFEKTYTCPVCEKEFKVKTIKTGKIKLVSADTDLRPKYQNVDSLKYDAVVCPHCGYSALNRFFNYMTSAQAKLIREQISSSFKGINEDGDEYTYDDAIARHKLALVNTIVKRSKISERAYTCLKTAWLLRGKAETLPEDTPDYEEQIEQLQNEELEFLTNAYEGFIDAFSKEMFPMCGMDEHTVTYLVADLARRVGNYDEASRWISKVLIARNANERIKAKARDLKELLKNK